jgi:hypothetical protein
MESGDQLLLDGSCLVFVLFDVAEEINLERPAGREPKFRHPVPDYVRFEHPPVVESAPEIQLSSGERFKVRVKYFQYGVISLELQLAFSSLTWDRLVSQAHSLVEQVEIESAATAIVRERVQQAGAALVKPYPKWLTEEYLVIQISGTKDRALSSAELLTQYGDRVSQLVRGDRLPLSEGEKREVLSSSVSYYPSDVLVVSWTAAVVYDAAEPAVPTLQLLEYANSQLLEFRHYDEVLTGLLAELYKVLERGGGLLRRWRMAREAARLNTIRLDVMELAERSEHAIRFLSDMYYARVYRLAAEKIGVTDYRNSVGDKLRIANELYQFIVNEFHHSRAFVLELMVVLILIIDLIYLFRGKT